MDDLAKQIANDVANMANIQIEDEFKATLLKIRPDIDLSTVSVLYNVRKQSISVEGISDDLLDQVLAIMEKE